MEDPEEHALVVRAITCRTGGCIEWKPRTLRRVLSADNLRGLVPSRIVEELIHHVLRRGPGAVVQKRETRMEYRDDEFFYQVIVPIEHFPRGVFVELLMHDRHPPEYPVVLIVSVHPQGV